MKHAPMKLATIAGLLLLSAAPARASSVYGSCLGESDPASCIAARTALAPPSAGWSERMDELVRAGAVETAYDFARKVRPMADIVQNAHRIPSGADLAALDLNDPEAAAAIRAAAKSDEGWREEVLAHAAAFQQRPLTAEAVAGYALAAAAYRSSDPFADPTVRTAFAVVKDEDVVPVLRGAAVLKIKFL